MAESLHFVFPGEDIGGDSARRGLLVDSANGQVYSCAKRYTPRAGDVVIGAVTFKTADFYRVDIRSSAPAMLPVTAFNGATKRHKPDLRVGSHVVCWVSRVDPDLDVELSCEDSGTQRDWSSGDSLFGYLPVDASDASLVQEISVSYAAQLLSKETHPVLRSLARHARAEIAVGHNGRVFVKAHSRAETLALVKTVSLGERLSPVQTEALLRGLLLQVS